MRSVAVTIKERKPEVVSVILTRENGSLVLGVIVLCQPDMAVLVRQGRLKPEPVLPIPSTAKNVPVMRIVIGVRGAVALVRHSLQRVLLTQSLARPDKQVAKPIPGTLQVARMYCQVIPARQRPIIGL